MLKYDDINDNDCSRLLSNEQLADDDDDNEDVNFQQNERKHILMNFIRYFIKEKKLTVFHCKNK